MKILVVKVNTPHTACCNIKLVYVVIKQLKCNTRNAKTGKTDCVCVVSCSLYAPCTKTHHNYISVQKYCGPGSSAGIATGYGLDGPGIEFRWGERFSAPVQTGPGFRPAFCTVGTVSFPGVKSGRRVTLTPYPLLLPWS